jgi:ribosome modulation factor
MGLELLDPFYMEGFDDFHLGYEKEDCPYDEGTDGQYGWLKGWKAANEKEQSIIERERKERDSRW